MIIKQLITWYPVFTSFQDFTTDKSQSFNVNNKMENGADVDITIQGDLIVRLDS